MSEPSSWERGYRAPNGGAGADQIQMNPMYQHGSLPHDYENPGASDLRIPLEERRDSDASSYHSDSERHRYWARTDHRDTTDLIESLPSRQLERLASDIAGKGTLRHRKSKKMKTNYDTIRFQRGQQDVAENLAQMMSSDPELMDEIDGEMRTNEALRGMNTTLSNKRQIKRKISSKKTSKKQQLSWSKMCSYRIGMNWMHFKHRLKEVTQYLELWKSHLKKIEGHFGTGVTSYFLFLKWLFYINIPVFLLTFSFIIIPQVLYRYNRDGTPYQENNVSFTGKELLTGGYWFQETEMYYGFYTNKTLGVGIIEGTKYDMRYAYLFTTGGYYLMCLVVLALSISRSYKKNYIEGSGTVNFYYVTRIFCGWDYGIMAKDAATLRKKSIYNEIKEFLSGTQNKEEDKTLGEKCKWFFIRTITNLLVLGFLGGSGYLVYYVTNTPALKADDNTDQLLKDMALPLVISGINLILPFIFSFIGRIEHYEKPKHELYIGMVRTMVLKAVTLTVLVYYWYGPMQAAINTVKACDSTEQSVTNATDSPTAEDCTEKRKEVTGIQFRCWETYVGEVIYRLVIVDFVFILLATFFMEFVNRQVYNKLVKTYCCKFLRDPEFNIGRNTLNLIYSQALCWLGTFYCPMLSLIMILKLFIIFYIKRISVVQNCKPSLRPWRASRAHTIFMGFLFLFFLLTTAAVTCGIIFVKPSSECGPFKQHETAYQVVIVLVNSWRDEIPGLHEVIKFISSPGFIAAVLVFLCVVTYYMRIVMVGHKEMVTLLRNQLSMEGRDKVYLLKMLQGVSKQTKEVRSTQHNRMLSPVHDQNLQPSPGGRRFIKSAAEAAASRVGSPDDDTESVRSRQRRRRDPHNPAGAASHM